MSGIFQEPVGRLWSADDALVGSGVLVQGTGTVYLLTCAHVVNQALGGGRLEAEQERPGPDDLVLFDVPGHSAGTMRHAARVVEWFAPVKARDRSEHPVSDIALLEVLGDEGSHAPLPGSLRLAHPEDFDFVEDDDIIRRREIKGFGFARENGGFAAGQITTRDPARNEDDRGRSSNDLLMFEVFQ